MKITSSCAEEQGQITVNPPHRLSDIEKFGPTGEPSTNDDLPDGCPNCGSYAFEWIAEIRKWECFDCGEVMQ